MIPLVTANRPPYLGRTFKLVVRQERVGFVRFVETITLTNFALRTVSWHTLKSELRSLENLSGIVHHRLLNKPSALGFDINGRRCTVCLVDTRCPKIPLALKHH
jgi:hypothetical protein